MIKSVIFSAAILASISAIYAAPLTLPDALYSINLGAGANGNGVCCAVTASYTAPGGYTLSDATATFATYPNLNGTASVGALASAGGSAFYYIGVIGAAPGVQIPLLVSGSLLVSASGNDASADAELTVGSPLLQSGAGVETGGATSWSGTLPIEYDSQYGFGSAYVEIILNAQNGGSDGGASAFADPYIYVDPSFPNAASYTVVVSEGIGNTSSATPEPGSLLLIARGLSALAMFGRKR